jgi:hypothetical protein
MDLPAGVPVYVPRDKDTELDTKLARGGLVLVVGDSTAGKSRAAYEAIHRLFGQRFLLVPNARASLQALLDGDIELRDTVVWLNDLERWLGPDGLHLGLLRRLLGDGHRQMVLVPPYGSLCVVIMLLLRAVPAGRGAAAAVASRCG